MDLPVLPRGDRRQVILSKNKGKVPYFLILHILLIAI